MINAIQKSILKKIEKLKKFLYENNRLYYVEGMSKISDLEYDFALKELQILEKKYKIFDKNSPTTNLNRQSSKETTKIKHNIPMLSIDNVYSFEELKEFDKKIKKHLDLNSYVIEEKLDGLSVSLIYKKGKLVYALTRGDGIYGEDITEKVKIIIENKINFKNNIEFRGEILIKKSDFEKLNFERKQYGLNEFNNPRNAAVGLIRQKENNFINYLSCFLYYTNNEKTQYENLKFLKNLNLPSIENFKFCENIEKCIEYINEFEKKRKNLDYNVDGLVIKLNDCKNQEKINCTSKYVKWAIAYKYKSENNFSKLLNVKFQIGRTGVLTPIAVFDPIRISNTIIKNATLHNINEIKIKNIGIGDTLVIEKSGEIIPKIIGVIKNNESKNITIPEFCPCCKNKLKISDLNLTCENKNCKEKIISQISFFVSKNAMNISGFARKKIELLFNENLIKNISDIYKIKYDDLIKIKTIDKKSAMNLIKSINKSKNQPFNTILFSLGIKSIGKKAANLLAKNFENFDDLIKGLNTEIIGIGENSIKEIKSFYFDIDNQFVLNNLKNSGLKI